VNIIQSHKNNKTNADEVFDLVLQSIKELDTVIRSVVRKTEEFPD
jgi:hypothetical protein